jgi:serine/threonine-protein kinase
VLSEDFPALAGFQPGSLLAGYRLEAQVGAGGMAVVFRARDQRLGRLVALKILTPALTADPAFRRRFIAESRAAAAVDDPHIIPVHEAGEASGVLFITMRFVAGGDLRRVLDREGALPAVRAGEFLSPVASALDAAHRAGLVHRDVKPANILVDASPGRPDHVYLSDFGVSKGATASVSLTGTGQFVGTPDYSAPEQIQGRVVDGRADQYALACVAYQLLTGEVPFERDQGLAVLLAHLSEPPPSLHSRRADLPEAADRVLARAMAKAPEQRYGSCGDFADALREAFGLALYHPRSSASLPDHPQAQIAPPPEFLGPATAGADMAAVPADPATAASLSAMVTMVPLVTETAPSPANSPAGQTHAEPDAGLAPLPGDGEQRATPASRDDHPRVAADGAGPGPGQRAPRPRRAGRAIRRRPVIIGIAVVGLAATGVAVGLVTTIPGTPSTSVSGTPSTSVSGTPSTSVSGTPSTSVSGTPSTSVSGTPSTSARWSYTTGGAVESGPAVSGGTVYVGSDDHKVYALDTATGHLRWSYTTGGSVSGPAVSGGTVYVGNGDDSVYALDAATGHLRWTYTTGAPVYSGPAVSGGTVYVGSTDDKLYALDAATGHQRWSFTTGGVIEVGPAVSGGTVYVGSTDDKVYALDAATGHLRWSYATGGAGYSVPAVSGGTVYVGSGDDSMYALDAATGHKRWSYTTGGALYSPAVSGGTVYVGGADGKLYALDSATGHLRWSYTTGNSVTSSPAVSGGTVYVGSTDARVYALDAATGHPRWSYTTGGWVSGPAVSGSTVYVGSTDDKLYALTDGS